MKRGPVGLSEKEKKIFDIKEESVKLKSDKMRPDCYLKDDKLEKMDFRLADMSYYHMRGDQLVEDIKKVLLSQTAKL